MATCAMTPAGDVDRVGQRRAKEPGSNDLKRHPEAVVITPSVRQELAIGVVEVEVACQLGRRGLVRVAAIASLLLVGKKINGHWIVAGSRCDSTDRYS